MWEKGVTLGRGGEEQGVPGQEAQKVLLAEPSVPGRTALHPAQVLIGHRQGNARRGAGPAAAGDADPCLQAPLLGKGTTAAPPLQQPVSE